jgi:hypothetical protein
MFLSHLRVQVIKVPRQDGDKEKENNVKLSFDGKITNLNFFQDRQRFFDS